MNSSALLWIAASFLSGSLPFSAWISRRFLDTNIRRIGDGNPGATNVYRAGGWGWGAVAALLDVLKAALPVGLAYFGAGVRGWPMVLIAVAAPLGHAFSPFLGWQGGKAIAASLGTWIGLTLGEGPIILGLFFALGELLLAVDGWAVMFGMAGLLGHLLLNHRDPFLLAVWLANTLLLAWTHRADLKQRPHLRPWLRERLSRPGE